MRQKLDLAIIGSGPAGLLAAHAAVQTGHNPIIYSRKVKSQIFGAQFLHRHIPGITPLAPELEIAIMKVGTREGYAQNVYGDPTHPVSWDKFQEGDIVGWDLKKAYDALWDLYQDRIFDVQLAPESMNYFFEKYNNVYTTVPATVWCHRRNDHEFARQDIVVRHGHGDHLIPNVNDNSMMYYNGFPPDGSVGDTIGPSWYRFSQINLYQAWEYRAKGEEWIPVVGDALPGQVIQSGFKPQGTNCDCLPGSFKKLGRFGRWQRDVLTHHVYEEAFNALQ